jgi:hypothetical protein
VSERSKIYFARENINFSLEDHVASLGVEPERLLGATADVIVHVQWSQDQLRTICIVVREAPDRVLEV